MPIVVNCPSCSAKFRVDDALRGKRMRCSKCSHVLTVTDGEPGKVAAPSAPVGGVVPPRPQTETPKPAPPIAKPIVAATPNVRTAAAPSAASPPQFAIQTGPAVSTATAGVQSASAPPPPGKKNNALVLMVAGGITGVVLIAGIAAFALSSGSGGDATAQKNIKGKKSTKKTDAPAVSPGTLVIQWPAAERADSSATVNGKLQAVPREGDFTVSLPPGKHQIVLKRRNFELVQESVEIGPNERRELTPQWKALPTLASNTPSTPTPSTPPSRTPKLPPVPDAGENRPGSFQFRPNVIAPRGFEGWGQTLPEAMQQAASEKKDILIVFGSSDASPKTVSLAAALKQAGLPGGELHKAYVPLVIDLPRSGEGGNRVVDVQENVRLLHEYGANSFDELPLLVLVDKDGKPYAVQREWPDGVREPLPIIEKLQTHKARRDQWLKDIATGNQQEQMDGAANMGAWVIESQLLKLYQFDFSRWYALVAKHDPDNQQGKLESLVEGEFLLRLQSVPKGDLVALMQTLGVMEPWLTQRKFQDPDRAVKLHVMVGAILMELDEEDDGYKHFARAATYQPKDAELRKRVEALKPALAERNILGNGTGYVVAAGGYIMTNRHVVEGPGKVMVRLPNVEKPVPAQVVKIDDELDAALLKVDFPADFNPRPLVLGPADPAVSAAVATYGYPTAFSLGEGAKFTQGHVTTAASPSSNGMMILDLKVNPGNSGGPLCDLQGNVVGMVTAKTGTRGFQDSYGLAIPVTDVRAFLKSNLPASVKLPANPNNKKFSDWTEVTPLLQEAVVMILKVK